MSITNVEPTSPPARPRVPEELASSTPFLMKRLGFAVKEQSMAAYEQAGLSPYHHGILAVLDEGSRETQATIADALAVDPSRLVSLLDSLEERELIVRQRDPHDRRRHVVSITGAGKRQLARLRAIAKELDEEFLAPLDAESRETFHKLLVQLAAHHDPRCAFGSQEALKKSL